MKGFVLSVVLLLFRREVSIACQIVFMTLSQNATDSFVYLLWSTELSSKWAEAMITRWQINRLKSSSSWGEQLQLLLLNRTFVDQRNLAQHLTDWGEKISFKLTAFFTGLVYCILWYQILSITRSWILKKCRTFFNFSEKNLLASCGWPVDNQKWDLSVLHDRTKLNRNLVDCAWSRFLLATLLCIFGLLPPVEEGIHFSHLFDCQQSHLNLWLKKVLDKKHIKRKK